MKTKRKKTIYEHFFKRLIDIVLSIILLVFLSPLFLVLAILVKIKLGSPIFFKQQRAGLHGKPFTIYKFRSMTNIKDNEGNLLPDEKRLSSFGLKLRSSSLDELPQLLNILKGQMSFIGPRPKLTIDYIFMNKNQKKIYNVRPGLTGLSQVSGRNDLSWLETLKQDNVYVQKISFFKDFKIFFKTFGVVFKKEGISQKGMLTTQPLGIYLLKEKLITKEHYLKTLKEFRRGADR